MDTFFEQNLQPDGTLPPGDFLTFGITAKLDESSNDRMLIHPIIFGNQDGQPRLLIFAAHDKTAGGIAELNAEAKKLGLSLESLRLQVPEPQLNGSDAEWEEFIREKKRTGRFVFAAKAIASLPFLYLIWAILKS